VIKEEKERQQKITHCLLVSD